MDGVLFDSQKVVNDFFLDWYPTMTREILDEILCGNFHEGLEKFKLTNDPRKETPEEKEARTAEYVKNKRQSPFYPGIRELVEKLHSDGFILTVNTSAFERNCLPLFIQSNTTQFFDFIATAEVSRSKVEKFNVISQKYETPTTEMLFITDTLGDVREAASAGVPTVAVTWGAHNRAYFTRDKNTHIVAIVDQAHELEHFVKSYPFS